MRSLHTGIKDACRAQDPQTKGQIEDLVKYTKSNYFSARLKDGLSIEKAIGGIPKWCDRKNMAIRSCIPRQGTCFLCSRSHLALSCKRVRGSDQHHEKRSLQGRIHRKAAAILER